jgi:predicted metal-dependent hydrolase
VTPAQPDDTVAAIARRAAALDLGAALTVRASPRARRLSLRIDAALGAVELVVPRRVAAAAALDFLLRQRGWIAARLAALPPRIAFAEGAVVPILGVPHRIRREFDRAQPPVAVGGGEIRVRGDPAHLARRVRDHLIALSRRELTARACLYAARLGRPLGRVGVRDPRSRWGSCSAAGSLSFSWRLVFAPEMVVDYVVAHEVAHLAEMNHGPRFWRVVAGLVPDSAAPRAWLRRHRNSLFSYG